jgi:hypothetical protein
MEVAEEPAPKTQLFPKAPENNNNKTVKELFSALGGTSLVLFHPTAKTVPMRKHLLLCAITGTLRRWQGQP